MKQNYDFSRAAKNPYAKRLKRQLTIKRGEDIGRIIASVKIDNVMDVSKSLRCDALVDTGASHMVLPAAWKERLGQMESTRTIELETATQAVITGDVCGPVRIQIEGFPAIYNEVSFVEMQPEDGAAILGDCKGKQSKEHYMSAGLWKGRTVRVRGFPWLEGQDKEIGVGSLQSRMLCRHHNNEGPSQCRAPAASTLNCMRQS